MSSSSQHENDDNILAKLEREAPRGKQGAPKPRTRLAWFGAAALILLLICAVAWLAYQNSVTRRALQGGATHQASVPVRAISATARPAPGTPRPASVGPVTRNAGAGPVTAVPEVATIVEQSAEPQVIQAIPAQTTPPTAAPAAAPTPAPAAAPVAAPTPATAVLLTQQTTAPAPARPPSPQTGPVAAGPASKPLARASPPPKPKALPVDADVAILSAIIAHERNHAAGAVPTSAEPVCGRDRPCPPKPGSPP